MKTWTLFLAGGAGGLLLAAGIMATAAQSETADQARVAALEARVTELEARLASTPDTLRMTAPKQLSITSGKSMTVAAGEALAVTTVKSADVTAKPLTFTAADEINIVTGKARIRLRKSGQIDITGSEINVMGDSDVQLKGRKVLGN